MDAIQAHNSKLVAKLRKEITRLGYECATPQDSHSALVSFSYEPKYRRAIAAKLKKATVQVKIGQQVIRVSPSVYNDVRDVANHSEALS